jgi:long-chain-fatty-acid--[acyl-carrier-protein] ligase
LEIEEKFVFINELRDKLTIRQRLEGVQLGRRSRRRLEKEWNLTAIDPHQTAAILFTSGTEKEPKGVPLSHENLLINEKETIETLGLQSSDVVLGLLPPFHIFGLSLTIWAPLLAGCRTVLMSDPLHFAGALESIERFNVTMICTTPTILQMLLQIAPPEKLASIRMAIVGAEKASPALYEQLKKLGIPLVEGYGATECSPLLTLKLPGRSTGVGLPLPSLKMKVIDLEQKKEVAKGMVVFKGPSVFAGYLGEVADPFIELDGDRWYITGDIGSVQPDGSLHLEGRLSRTVKLGGELIPLVLVEATLYEEWVKKGIAASVQVAVVSVEKLEGRPELIAFTTLPIDLEQANQLLRQGGLSNLIRLGRVIHLEKFPLLGTGKIDYRRLKQVVSDVH